MALIDPGVWISGGIKRLKTVDVDVSEWDGPDTQIRIRELGAGDREWFQSQAFADEEVMVNGKSEMRRKFNIVHLRAKLLSRAIIDASGNRPHLDEVDKISEMPNGEVEKLFVAAQKLSGLDQTAVDDATKNSVAAPNSGSNSGSHSPSGEPSPSLTEVSAAAN